MEKSGEDSEASSCDQSIQEIVHQLNGSVHLDALAYNFNLNSVVLLSHLKKLEQKNQVLCCYRTEDDEFS